MKFLSSLLVSMLLVTLVPVTVFAGPSEDDPDGSYENPFLISDCEDLQAIASYEDYVYSLTGDIDCSVTVGWNGGAGFVPIESFQGAILGNGHTVSNLYINLPGTYKVGFINDLSGIVANITFDGLEIVGDSEVGLIGRISDRSILADVKVTNGQVTGNGFVGGLAGMVNFGYVFNSSFSGDVVSASYGGGLIGYIASQGNVHDNYFNGIVNAVYAGGLIGYIEGITDEVYNNYTTGTVTGSTNVGAMVGSIANSDMLFTDNFSNVSLAGTGLKGGLVGAVNLGAGNVAVDGYYFDQNNAGDVDCVAELASGTFDSDGCVTWDSSVDADYLIANTLDSPVTAWDFEDVWQTSVGFPTHRRTTEYSPPTVPLNLDGEVTSLVSALFTFDAPADLGNLPLIEYNFQIQYEGENWEYPIYDSYVWYTDDREISIDLPFKGTDYKIRINAENILGKSEWVEFDFSSDVVDTVDISTCEELRDIDLDIEGFDLQYNLTQDIDCAGVEFQSIGDNEWSVFTGILDGNDYTISNLTINEESSYTGLFKEISGGVVRDLNLENLSISGTTTVGGLVGRILDANITNVSVEGDVTSTAEAGGVIGRIDDDYYVYLSDVTFNGNVVGAERVGGVIGSFEIDDEGDMVLQKLASHGTVVASGSNVGGIIGDLDFYSDDDDVIVRILKSYSTASVEGLNNTGGFIGYLYLEGYDDNELYIEDSFASGDVTGDDSVGGFVGYLEPYYDDDNTIISIDRVYASGDVEGTTNVGGLIGYLSAPDDYDEEVYLLNSFATGLVTSAGVGGGLVGFTEEFDIADEDELYVSNNFYAAATGYTVCDSEEILEDCELVEEVSDFYIETNEPFVTGNWDSEDVWQFEDGYLPVLAWPTQSVTEPPELLTPESNSSYELSEPIPVVFILAESLLSSSLKLVFTPEVGDAITIDLRDASPRVQNSLNIIPNQNMSLLEEVIATTSNTIPEGVYDVTISYQDLFGNPRASTTNTNISIMDSEMSSGGGSSSGSRVGGGGGKTETTSDSSYQAEVKEVLDKGIVTENPDFSTNKCEALVMMARVFKWEVGTDTNDIYTDTPEWCGAYARFGTERGIVEGRTPTTLGMETPVTRYEIAVMLYRELQKQNYEFKGTAEVSFSDTLTPWAKEAVEALAKEGIINGFANGTFGGDKGILKQDAAIMIFRFYKKNTEYSRVDDSSSRI